ncbi:hypothetical protein FRC07_010846, partial [Ceratobasidium sp. 392]
SPPTSPLTHSNSDQEGDQGYSTDWHQELDDVVSSHSYPRPSSGHWTDTDEDVDVEGISDEENPVAEHAPVLRQSYTVEKIDRGSCNAISPSLSVVSHETHNRLIDSWPLGTNRAQDIDDEGPGEHDWNMEGVIDLTHSDEDEPVHAPTENGAMFQEVFMSSSLDALASCLSQWNETCDWENAGESNPLWDVVHNALMGEHVMDHVTSYLVHSSAQLQPRTFHKVCLIPSSLSGVLLQMEHVGRNVVAQQSSLAADASRLFEQRDKVWTHGELPNVVIMPFINHLQVHCYVWYGHICKKEGTDTYDLHLNLLDSLARPSPGEIKTRLGACISILRVVLPQVNGLITGDHVDIPAYRQSLRSTDCGWFVCQAVSAIAWRRLDALHRLLPMDEVKTRLWQILQECKAGILDSLATGHIVPEPIVLHRSQQPASPPWRPKQLAKPEPSAPVKVEQWVAPKIERSLSEPAGDSRPGDAVNGGWEDVFGSRVSIAFEEVSGEAFRGYLEAIASGGYQAPEGLLAGVGVRLPDSLMKALLLEDDGEDHLDWAPHARCKGGSDEEGLLDPDGGVGLQRFLTGLESLPSGMVCSKAVLTGEHMNTPLMLNWIKESIDVEEEWLTAGFDIDSLSLTASDPQFTSPITFYAYPPRASTLTTDNGLSVNVNGQVKKMSHIPNFTFAHTGPGNSFRINICFPHFDKGKDAGGRVINMVNNLDSEQWWELVVCQAVWRMEVKCPPEYRNAAAALRQALPRRYDNAKPRAGLTGETFKGYKILPELFNLMI